MNKPSPSLPTVFRRADSLPGSVATAAAGNMLAALGDVALVLDRSGRILDLAVNAGDLANHGIAAWIGEAWVDTVTVESRPKIVELLAAAHDGPARWRQVNHPVAGGDVPIDYLALTLSDDRIVAIGRDLRAQAAMQQRLLQAQQSLERDYIRLRQTETRYRLLFDAADEAILVLDAATRRIREANAAAYRLLGAKDGELVGEPATAIAAPTARDSLVAYLGAAAAADAVAPLTVPLRHAGIEVQAVASLFRQGGEPLLLLRLDTGDRSAAAHTPAALADVVERMPDAFVLADRNLVILSANTAFVDLTGVAAAERVIGEKLATWLGRPGIDLDLIVGQLRDHDAVRNVATIVRGLGTIDQEVEVSAVAAPRDGETCYGFVIRSVARRLRDAPAIPRDMPRSVEQLTELVGRVSLKDIVRESTDLVERLCIEAALAYTSDNRASAAEILGVSRQSLYSKLHRHGLGNLVSNDE